MSPFLANATDPEARPAPNRPFMARGPTMARIGSPRSARKGATGMRRSMPPIPPHSATLFKESSSRVWRRSAMLRITAKAPPAKNPWKNPPAASTPRTLRGTPPTRPATEPNPAHPKAQVRPVPMMPRNRLKIPLIRLSSGCRRLIPLTGLRIGDLRWHARNSGHSSSLWGGEE